MKFIICLILIVLIMIAEKGVPVKLEKEDYIVYGICLGAIYIFL